MLIGHDDWTWKIDDKKSTSGGAFFLGKRLVSWTSKKKNYTSQSTVEVEYVVTIVNCSNIVWFKKLLEGMNVEIKGQIFIFVTTPMQLTYQRTHWCTPKQSTLL